jgi:phosphatidyl-myo-inositol dimannoside synthase
MKILIYTHEFLPFAGGIATYNYELACGLAELGHEVLVLAPQVGEQDISSFPFKVVWIEDGRFRNVVFRAFRGLRSVVRDFQPDVILASEHYAHIVSSVYSWFSSTPCIPIIHGSEILRQTDCRNLFKRFLAWELTRFYRSVRKVICISAYTRGLFLDAFPIPEDQVVVVHNGMRNQYVAEMHDGEAIRKRWNIPKDAIVLLTLARLTPRKGQDVVIRAMPELLKSNPSLYYICAGKGEYAEGLANLANECGVADHVVFPGRVDEEDKYAYYAACDMFVMPSREDKDGVEGFGLSFLEAWHASRAVLGSTHGGVVEVIDDGQDGVIVDPEDIDGVARVICGLLADSGRLKAMGEVGYAKAQSKFTDVAMARGILAAIGDRDRS